MVFDKEFNHDLLNRDSNVFMETQDSIESTVTMSYNSDFSCLKVASNNDTC